MTRRLVAGSIAFGIALLGVVSTAQASTLCALCATLNDSDPAWWFFGCYFITLPCVA